MPFHAEGFPVQGVSHRQSGRAPLFFFPVLACISFSLRLSHPISLDDEAFGYLKRVIVTPAVYPRLVEFLHFDIQSTGQKSHCANTVSGRRNALF